MSTVRNTSKSDPIENLVTALPGGIEAQEAQGQRELVNSTVLPYTLRGSDADFETLGFTFGGQVPGDDLFREATLPEGWTREGSGHAMWSYILDERGIRRVAIFYKAAFYDRSAHMNLSNVGCMVAQDFIYGDEKKFALREDLTATELEDLKSAAASYLEDVERHPDIYGDREPRARQILETIEAAEAP